MPGILGKKVGMTRIIEDDGSVVPVSVIECTPNEVLQVKTTEKDGYPALILGFDAYNKPTKNKKWKHVAEFRLESDGEYKVGDKIDISVLTESPTVRVTGWAKGKGFAGVIKRHNFSRGPETHGSHHHREPGSAGGVVTGTGRVPKGKRYPGHMGTQRVTKKGVKVVMLNKDKQIIAVKGPVPGATRGLILLSA